MYWHANSADEHDWKFRPCSTTICLLDDNPSIVKAVSRLLLCAGWRVQAFTDPMTFLIYAFDHQPCVAVLDILMPAMNGLEVLRRLPDVSPSTRVIILSSSDDPIVRATAMREGASDFFIKGIENEGFLAGIESALGKNRHEASDSSEEVASITAVQSAATDT